MADQDELYQKRQGFWLRIARERAGKSQAGAAEYIGMSPHSKSSISDYENGVTPVPLKVLRRLANWYGVPLRLFSEPPMTAFEQVDAMVSGTKSAAGDTQVTPDLEAAIEGQRGWWLTMARERAGLSQGQLAIRMGVDSRTIRSWEERRTQPSMLQEIRLRDILDIRKPRPQRVAGSVRERIGENRRRTA